MSFLTWGGMMIRRQQCYILFHDKDDNTNTTLKFRLDCYNDSIAAECYKHLLECLTDPESQGCNLHDYHATMRECWDYVPEFGAKLKEALTHPDRNQSDYRRRSVFNEYLKEIGIPQKIGNLGSTFDSNDYLGYYTRFIVKFHELQNEGDNQVPKEGVWDPKVWLDGLTEPQYKRFVDKWENESDETAIGIWLCKTFLLSPDQAKMFIEYFKS